MRNFFLKVFDRLSKNRALSLLLLLGVVAICVWSALRLEYKENIADFLPTDPERERYISVYNDLGDQGTVTVIFRLDTSKLEGKDAAEELADAVDAFETNWQELDTLALVNDLQCKVDGGQVFDAIDFMRDQIPLFLEEGDFRRMDSLLAVPGYVASCMENNKRMLFKPTAGFVVDGLKADPLGLYSPVLQRLNALNPVEGYRMEEGYLFNESQDCAFAFFSSPFSSSDTKNNAVLIGLLDEVVQRTECDRPSVKISAVGAPVIAYSNARQIKKDSILSMALAIVLILGILMFTMASKRNLLWLGISILFGWLFALAVIAFFKSSISIIVVGIGSVILGIAVNYPLHYLDHLKQEPDKRAALKDVVQPLVIGNITTVAAFACLVFVKAEAMRDLGVFGALTLVGTILFVMVFLPLFAKVPKKGNRLFVDDGQAQSATWRKVKLYAFWPIVIVTMVLAYFGRETAFDADLHHINYMTHQQEQDLELLSRSFQSEGDMDVVYVVSESEVLQEAVGQNEMVMSEVRKLVQDDSIAMVSGLDGLLPSLQKQERSLELWHDFWQRHPDVSEQVKSESLKAGFTENAFASFLEGIEKTYVPHTENQMEPLMGLCGPYILKHDSLTRVVNFVKVPAGSVESLKQQLRQAIPESCFAFSISDVGNNLVEMLSGDFDYILYVCSLVVFLFLCLSFGRLELSLLAFLPLTVGWAWILGIMHLGGVQFNIVNIILATFIFGQGDDYTIFITEGLLYEYAYGKRMLKNYRSSVVLSGVLMFVGIGALIIAQHPAMRSLAVVAMIGMAIVVFMACYLPPVVFNWLTRKKGQLREVPLTLKRLVYTFLMFLVFFIATFVIATPFTILYKLLIPESEKKRYRFHKFLCNTIRLATRLLPGVKFNVDNKLGETFEKPAVIIANHQSSLDLLCVMMLHPKVVLMTADWVWKDPFYGRVIRYAEYFPASNGYEKNLEHLKRLVARGYSVVVFPEGTRSMTGEIIRFHKGAFQLAKDLNVDILPIFIHGAYQAMPKKDFFVLREGSVNVIVGNRVQASELETMEARALASRFHQYYVEHYEAIRKQYENTEYVLPYVRYKYVYKGKDVEKECRRTIKRIRTHASEIDALDCESVLLRNSGLGELAWTIALAHRDIQIYAVEADEDAFMIASHCSNIPGNLHFAQLEKDLPDCSLIIDSQMFLK